MHEMSIAMSILEEVEKHVAEHEAKVVEELVLEVGDLAGIEIDALTFALNSMKNNSILKKTDYRIEQVEGRARCLECKKEYEMKQLYDCCPVCESYFKDILEGKELRIKSITLLN